MKTAATNERISGMTKDETKAYAKNLAVDFAWRRETTDALTVADLRGLAEYFFNTMNSWYQKGYDDATAEHFHAKDAGAK